MKNPFPVIGKIIKYEFKHSSKILLPLYGVLLTLGLLTGLSFSQNKMNRFMDSMNSSSNFEYHVEGTEAVKEMISGLLVFVVIALSVTITVLTIVTIARRFKQSMLSDEAYLNLSLPATMGQQLWGRFITDLLFMILCGLVIALTIILCFIRMNIFEALKNFFVELNRSAAQQDFSLGQIFSVMSIISLSMCVWAISIIFVVNAISHLLKNNKSVIKFITVILLLWINAKLFNLIPNTNTADMAMNSSYYFTRNGLLAAGILLFASAIYFAFTQYVFTKKLNLE